MNDQYITACSETDCEVCRRICPPGFSTRESSANNFSLRNPNERQMQMTISIEDGSTGREPAIYRQYDHHEYQNNCYLVQYAKWQKMQNSNECLKDVEGGTILP